MPVVADLPVGENFRDHYSTRIVARVKNITTINEMSNGMGLAGQIARWAMGKPSILAVSPSLVHWFWKSEDTMDQPDLQGVFSPASYKQGFVGLLDDYPGMTCGVWQHRPESIGYVRARSTDPFEDPIIQPNYLTDPMDQRVLMNGMKLARKLLHTQALAPYFDGDELPGPDVQTRRRVAGLCAPVRLHRVSSDRHRADGTGERPDRGGGRPVAGARVAGAARRRCLDHAEHAVGQYLQFDDDDRGEGVGHDPRPSAAGAGGGRGAASDVS